MAHERAACHNELVRLEEKRTSIERLAEHKGRQLKEWQHEREALKKQLEAGQEQLQQLEAELKRLEEEKAVLEGERRLKEQELATLERELAGWQERRRTLAAQIKVWHQAQDEYEGFTEGVKFIMQASKRGRPL